MNSEFINEIAALMAGLGRSLLVSVIGMALAMALGLLFAACRYAKVAVLSQLIACYVNVFRCTPLLVQIVMLYFALPDLGLKLTPFETSWLALGLWGAAYFTEIYRAGFVAVPANEVLAARALGLPAVRTFLDVTLPRGLRTSLPTSTTMAITLFRSSSFMIAIGYQELTYVANQIVADTFKVFETFALAALIYLLVSNAVAMASRYLEQAIAIPGMGAKR